MKSLQTLEIPEFGRTSLESLLKQIKKKGVTDLSKVRFHIDRDEWNDPFIYVEFPEVGVSQKSVSEAIARVSAIPLQANLGFASVNQQRLSRKVRPRLPKKIFCRGPLSRM